MYIIYLDLCLHWGRTHAGPNINIVKPNITNIIYNHNHFHEKKIQLFEISIANKSHLVIHLCFTVCMYISASDSK